MTGSAPERTSELRGLLDQLARIETRERTLLAEVVHDEPIQLIVAALLRIDLLQARLAGTDADQLDHVVTLLELAVERLRRLIIVLNPPDLSEGLGVALRSLADGIFVETTTTFHLSGRIQQRLAVPAEEAIHRIFREAMVNARKHSRAANVTLSLGEHNSEVVVTLTDDGVGSESLHAGPGHLGITLMYARAAAEGGNLRIISEPGRGTVVELTLTAPVDVIPERSSDHEDQAAGDQAAGDQAAVIRQR